MVADRVHAMGRPSLFPTTSFRKTNTMTERYKKPNQTTIYSSHVPIWKGGNHRHLLGAGAGVPLPWLTQSRSVPPGHGFSPAEHPPRHGTRARPAMHTVTREHLTHEKIYLYIHSVLFLVLHKLEATFGEKACFQTQAAGLEMRSVAVLSPESSPWPG